MAKLWRVIRRRPVTSVAIVLLVVALAAGGVYWFGFRNKAVAATTATTRTELYTVSTGDITKSISATGTLTPAEQDEVNFGASGTVTAVRVAEGDTVKKGQLLATVDTVDLEAELASAKANLAQINARVAADATAVSDAADTDETTDDAAAAAQLAADKASLATAKTQVTAAQQALAAARLTSPISGIVAEVNVATGDKVTASNSSNASSSASSGSGGSGSGSGGSGGGSGAGSDSSSSSGSSSSAAFLVVGTTAWQADLSVDDSQIGLLKKGLQARLTVDSATSTLFGRVSAVGLISTSSSDTASYPVVVTLTGSPTGLHDGASATIEVVYQLLSNVLVVPTQALHVQDGKTVVYKQQNGLQVTTPVTVGTSSGGRTQVTAGLSEGDQIEVTTTRSGATGSGRSTNGSGTGTRSGTGGYGGYGGTGGFGAGGFTGPGGGEVPGGQVGGRQFPGGGGPGGN